MNKGEQSWLVQTVALFFKYFQTRFHQSVDHFGQNNSKPQTIEMERDINLICVIWKCADEEMRIEIVCYFLDLLQRVFGSRF